MFIVGSYDTEEQASAAAVYEWTRVYGASAVRTLAEARAEQRGQASLPAWLQQLWSKVLGLDCCGTTTSAITAAAGHRASHAEALRGTPTHGALLQVPAEGSVQVSPSQDPAASAQTHSRQPAGAQPAAEQAVPISSRRALVMEPSVCSAGPEQLTEQQRSRLSNMWTAQQQQQQPQLPVPRVTSQPGGSMLIEHRVAQQQPQKQQQQQQQPRLAVPAAASQLDSRLLSEHQVAQQHQRSPPAVLPSGTLPSSSHAAAGPSAGGVTQPSTAIAVDQGVYRRLVPRLRDEEGKRWVHGAQQALLLAHATQRAGRLICVLGRVPRSLCRRCCALPLQPQAGEMRSLWQAVRAAVELLCTLADVGNAGRPCL